MGEYFIIVNLDKKEYIAISPLKFYEQIANCVAPIALYWLVTHKHWDDKYKTLGRWAGDRVIVVGDYDEEYEWVFREIDCDKIKDITREVCSELAEWCREKELYDLVDMLEFFETLSSS